MDVLNCLSFEVFEEIFLGELMNGSVICVFKLPFIDFVLGIK